MRLATPTALLLACALLGACGDGDGATVAKTDPPPAPALSDAQKQAMLASLPAPYNTADLENGQRKYALCRSCHTLPQGGPSMTGPNLHGLFGRVAGTGDYRYSDALKASGIVWTAATLDPWLESPRKMVPGTKMAFAGMKDPKDRIDLIGYLKVEAGDQPAG